jgi:type II secretory pathway component HofQ
MSTSSSKTERGACSGDPQAMHRDHRTWLNDDAQWRDDVLLWEQKTTRAVAALRNLEGDLLQHLELLRKHAAAIRLYEQDAVAHEKAVAELERASGGALPACPAPEHDAETDVHARQGLLHERLKHAHRTLLARCLPLLEAGS